MKKNSSETEDPYKYFEKLLSQRTRNLHKSQEELNLMIESLNSLIDDLVFPTVEITRVITAVSKGNLTQAVSVETNGKKLEGEFLKSAKTLNAMVEQLNFFTQEVTRVSREVGVEGKLGGQAVVKGLFGSWKDLTDNVNFMASNLTAQVRNIAT